MEESIQQNQLISNQILPVQASQDGAAEKKEEHSRNTGDDSVLEWDHILSCYDMPEGSPAFESILTELVTKFESSRIPTPYPNFDDSTYKWVTDDIESTGMEENNLDKATESTDDNTTEKPRLIESKTSPRPYLRSLEPDTRVWGKMNKFPLRKKSSPSSSPLNSPPMQRSKPTRTRPQSAAKVQQKKKDEFKFVFQTISTSVLHEDLVMEKLNEKGCRSMFENTSPRNHATLVY